MSEIEELEKDIKYYADCYYRGDTQISDEQFDLLVERLRQLKPDSKVLTTGWGFEVNGDKVKHKYSHVGSLDKCKSFDDFPERFKDKIIYLSPKLDGLSCVVYYQNGKLVKAVTRGNGTYGKDITDKLKLIIGEKINDKQFRGAVRGELIIHKDNWNKLLEKYKELISSRNFVAGIINRKEIDEDIQYIDLVVYKIIGQENKPVWTNRSDILAWLGSNFKHYIPNLYLPVLTQQNWEKYRDNIFEQFKNIGYDLDGIVLTRETALYDERNNSLNFDEVAYKFPAESTTTVVKNINWELSRTDRMIPVGNVEPVELSGAIVQNVTFNNAKWVKDLGLGKGAEISICRSNEVIPTLLDVISPVEPDDQDLPKNCPICGQLLNWVGVDLKCLNKTCYGKKSASLQQWCEVIGETDSFAWLLMRQYLDKFDIGTLEDLYNKEDEILDWFRKSELSITDHKAYEFYMKIYVDKVNIEKALLALNIPRFGDKTVQILGQEEELILRFFDLCLKDKYYSYDVDFTDEINKFIELIKDANTKSLLENKDKFTNLKYLINKDRLIFNKKQDKSEIKYIAVTGALESMKRKDFEKYIKQYGYELTSNLKKCKYLVNNDINSTSTKNKEAKQYDIPIITEQEFLSSLN